MDNQHLFLKLVKQDIKRRSRRKRHIPRQWWLAYLAFVFLIAIVAATFKVLHGGVSISYIWYFTFALPFAVFGVSTGITAHEWKNGTSGWWLSLPFSRLKLIASKFCAGFARGIMIFIVVYVAIAFFGLYMMLLGGNFHPGLYLRFLKQGLEWFLLLLSISPFMAALGVLFGILNQSRAKPIIPLFWSFWGVMWWLVFSNFGSHLAIHAGSHLSLTGTVYDSIAASWIAAYFMVRLSAYLLDRQLAL